MFPIKNRGELEKLEKPASLKNQVIELRLQDKLGKQNFHENIKKLYDPFANKIEDTSRDITKVMTETSNINIKALEHLNEKVLELMNDNGMIAPFLTSSLVNLFKTENTSQCRLT